MRKVFKMLCVAVSLMLTATSYEARASHAAGGELIYQWVSDSTWKFTFKFYRDCAGIPEPTSMTLCYFNTCDSSAFTPINMAKSAALPATGNEVSPGCPGFPTTCNAGTLPGYIEFWYEATVTLPFRCNKWIFTVSEGSRNASVNNLLNAAANNLHVRAELNNTILPYNSSVYFTNKPVPYVCMGAAFSFNNGAIDPDADKLVFSSIQPLNGNCAQRWPTAIDYNPASFTGPPPNVQTNPFNTNNTYNVDAVNGTVSFTAQQVEIAVITVKVDEYRAGQFIGSVMRDIQIIVRSCNFQSPSSQLDPATLQNVTVLPNGYILACPSGTLQFCFQIQTADPGALLKISNNLPLSIPTASLSSNYLAANSVYLCFAWTPTMADTGVNTFTVTATDTSCRPPGIQLSQTFAYSIFVAPPTVIIQDTAICEGDTAFLHAENGTLFTWSVVPGGDDMSSVNYLSTDRQYIAAFPNKTTQYIVKSNLDPKCKITDTATVRVVNLYGSGEIVTSPNDTAICEPGYVNLRSSIFTKPPPPATQHTYIWQPGMFVNDSTQANTFAFVDETRTFTITAWDSLGCEIRDTTRVIVSVRDFGITPADTSVCLGDRYVLDARGGVKWRWSGNNALYALSCVDCENPVALPLNSGTYQVIISDQYDCADTFTSNIIVKPLPVIEASPADTLVRYGIPVTIKATGGVSYSWQPLTGLSNPDAASTVVVPVQNTKYVVTGRGQNGCAATDTVRIRLDMRDKLYLPTAFSPNRDGVNDYFKVVNLTFQDITEFRVYDRWGMEVFNGVGSGKAIDGWDGMTDKKDAPVGVYHYIIRIAYPDGFTELLKGDVTLIR